MPALIDQITLDIESDGGAFRLALSFMPCILKARAVAMMGWLFT